MAQEPSGRIQHMSLGLPQDVSDDSMNMALAGYRGPGWYFWDETDAHCHGPYINEDKAREAFFEYARVLNYGAEIKSAMTKLASDAVRAGISRGSFTERAGELFDTALHRLEAEPLRTRKSSSYRERKKL